MLTHIDGEDRGKIVLYALSTCLWCRKTRELLDKLQVAYDYVYIDQLGEEERAETTDEVAKWNPDRTFPTIIIDDNCIVGYEADKIQAALHKWK